MVFSINLGLNIGLFLGGGLAQQKDHNYDICFRGRGNTLESLRVKSHKGFISEIQL